MGKTLHFVMLFVGMCVVFASVGGFLMFRDYTYRYSLSDQSDTYPLHSDEHFANYEDLSPAKQRIVDGAIGGKAYTFSSSDRRPPGIVRKGDTYYLFSTLRSFDWFDPGVWVSTIVFFVGWGLAIEGVRRDIFPNDTLREQVARRL